MNTASLCSFPSRVFRWLRRFRKRCGYGIHSPYAFQLVSGVIYEKATYYASSDFTNDQKHTDLRTKDIRLLFRLANFSEAHSILVVGNHLSSVSQAFRAARPSASLKELTPEEFSPDTAPLSVELLYLDHAATAFPIVETLLSRTSDRTVFILRHIHQSKVGRDVWQQLKTDPRVRVTFDLYDFGIACFESRLVKENYIINYF